MKGEGDREGVMVVVVVVVEVMVVEAATVGTTRETCTITWIDCFDSCDGEQRVDTLRVSLIQTRLPQPIKTDDHPQYAAVQRDPVERAPKKTCQRGERQPGDERL